MSPFAHITGWGMAVPERILSNEEIAQMVDTTDQWIQDRTGIKERRIAGEADTTASLATQAALKALEMANLKPSEIDLIIVATSSPEYIFPATACLVQDQIGASKAGAFDLLAACTGFIYALSLAAQTIRSGAVQQALVIGAETLSRVTNWEDRNTCILFGDGAGAFVLQASPEPGGLLSQVLRSDGSGSDLLSLPGGGSRYPANAETLAKGLHTIHMNGREVFRFATRVMTAAVREAVEGAGLTVAELQWIIPHQANRRIIEAAARGLDFPMERCVVNVERYGNTSTASIPIAACEAAANGQLQPGDKIAFVGFGGGLTWGAAIVQWSGPILPKRRIYPRSYRLWLRLRSMLQRILRSVEGLIWGRKFPEI